MTEKQTSIDYEQNKSFLEKFRNLLRAPTFGDLTKDRIAGLQNTILLSMLAAIVLAIFTWDRKSFIDLALVLGIGVFFSLALFFLRRGYIGTVSWLLIGTIFLALVPSIIIFGLSILNVLMLAILLTLTSMLLQPKIAITISAFTLLSLVIFFYFQPPQITEANIIQILSAVILEGLLLMLASRALEKSFAQANRSAESLMKVNKNLQDLTTNLEQRVEDRTKALAKQTLQLQAATEVSRTVSSVLDADELIQKAVNLVRDRFDLYYVGLFLLDEQRHFAVLEAGTGEAGRQMLVGTHKLEVNDASMIGWCITHKQARIVLDVDREAVRLSNPLLPNTHSELALPLISQGQVIGAMTVQSEQESAFTEEDVTILQTMADQLANGIEKARLYEQIQQRAIELDKARKEAESARVAAEEANRSLATQMWQTAGQALLNEKMRGEQDISTLSHNVIQHLCKYLKVYSGSIYILEDKVLQLISTYAYRRKSFEQQYQIGEDLVGQAAIEKKTISNAIPDDYIALSLLEGKVLPQFRLITPIVYNNEVSGVVALESTIEFTPEQRRFLEEAIESVAIAIITAQARTRVNELFSQTRQQAEELQAQKEELRATNEELEAQTESLRASETLLKTNQTDIKTTNVEL